MLVKAIVVHAIEEKLIEIVSVVKTCLNEDGACVKPSNSICLFFKYLYLELLIPKKFGAIEF